MGKTQRALTAVSETARKPTELNSRVGRYFNTSSTAILIFDDTSIADLMILFGITIGRSIAYHGVLWHQWRHSYLSALQQCCKAYPAVSGRSVELQLGRGAESTDSRTDLGQTADICRLLEIQSVACTTKPLPQRGCHCQSGQPGVRTTRGSTVLTQHTVVMLSVVKQYIAVRKLHLTAAGNHMPYGITQCYLPPGRGDFPTFTPAKAGTRLSDPEGWVDLDDYIPG